jgi:5-methyltetrahydropteroyltriglutamate--homocysteine methyltransferase
MFGVTVAPVAPMVCTGPVRYCGQAALRKDLDNLKAALSGRDHVDAFVPAVAPSGVGRNEYYASDDEYFHAVGAALRVEYEAIVDAGFLLQVDDPFMADVFVDRTLSRAEQIKRADLHVEVINEAIAGIPAERVRFHTCYGINEGPRVHEASMYELVGHMLRVNAGAYSFEAANCRHEHEYHLWETVRLPDGKRIMPCVITHASNIVEHPELIAERLTRFANLVGRDNVIASADCGLSSQACYRTEVHPTVIRVKLQAMAEGARLATKRLWPH